MVIRGWRFMVLEDQTLNFALRLPPGI